MQEIESKIITTTKSTLAFVFMSIASFLLYLSAYLSGYKDAESETELTKEETENLNTVIGAFLIIIAIYTLFKIFG